MNETTRLIETGMGYASSLAWECEKCSNVWCFTGGTPQQNSYKYCCNCGREITEYIPFKEVSE